jgi:hypothetical protein
MNHGGAGSIICYAIICSRHPDHGEDAQLLNERDIVLRHHVDGRLPIDEANNTNAQRTNAPATASVQRNVDVRAKSGRRTQEETAMTQTPLNWF